MQSHALRRLHPAVETPLAAQIAWRAALKAAPPAQLLTIAQLAEGWGYAGEAEEAWWLLANQTGEARASLSALQRIYQAKRDTRGLLRVARRALELDPGDLVAANNCASLGLLLDPGDRAGFRLAEKLHADHPQNRAFTATFAYALHAHGRTAEASRVLETLDEKTLRDPAIAAYYVCLLAAEGRIERARNFLLEAKRAALLPEEEKLLAAASRKILADNSRPFAPRLASENTALAAP